VPSEVEEHYEDN
jgi:hypothetical protein